MATSDNSPAHPTQYQGASVHGVAQVTANFALQHIRAAILFRDKATLIEAQNVAESFDDIRSYCSACVMSSAAALEALINEMFMAEEGVLRGLMLDFETEFWGKKGIEGKRILAKYQLALSMLKKQKLDETSSPYREAWCLVELRNALVHYKPPWDPISKRRIEIAEILSGQFAVSPFVDTRSDFVSKKCMSAGCAKWAVDTAIAFVHEFDLRARLDDKKFGAFTSLANCAVTRNP